MTPRKVTIRVREDDLRIAADACHEWYDTLADAAHGNGYGKPDPSTMRAARRGLAAAARLRAALAAAKP